MLLLLELKPLKRSLLLLFTSSKVEAMERVSVFSEEIDFLYMIN